MDLKIHFNFTYSHDDIKYPLCNNCNHSKCMNMFFFTLNTNNAKL